MPGFHADRPWRDSGNGQSLKLTPERGRRIRLRKECTEAAATWPLPDSRKQVTADWMAAAKGTDGKPWTKITLLSEGGFTPDKWAERIQQAAPKP